MENFRVKIKNIFRNFQLSSKGYDEKNEKIITVKLNRILRNLAIIILLSYLTLIYVAVGLYVILTALNGLFFKSSFVQI